MPFQNDKLIVIAVSAEKLYLFIYTYPTLQLRLLTVHCVANNLLLLVIFFFLYFINESIFYAALDMS